MKYSLLIFLLFFCLGVSAQRQKKVEGTYTYYATDSQTPAQVKYYALQYARAEAIANVFGTKVSVISTMTIDGGKDHFSQVSENNVGGVWLKDTEPPIYELGAGLDGKNGYSITCTVKGIVREKKTSTVQCTSKVFCNGFERHQERDVFYAGEDFFMKFLSPVDGYLVIYNYNCNDNVVYSALPCDGDASGNFEVKANKEYRLFVRSDRNGVLESEYKMDTSGADMELSIMYVIFSPNKFYKAPDHDGDDVRLRNLEFADFEKWLGKLRSADDDVSVTMIPIEVRRAKN